MERIAGACLVVVAFLGFIGWLGGGRKWAFRVTLSAVILCTIGILGVALYLYATEKAAAHRSQKIHECAIAKVADPKCVEAPKSSAFPAGSYICPLYDLPNNPTPEQEQVALEFAEKECTSEMNPAEKSLHEQIIDYRVVHKIMPQLEEPKSNETGPWTKYSSKGDISAEAAKACAAKVRKAYPAMYDDLDDPTLSRKVLKKYPHFCDTPGPKSEIQDIR